MARLQPLWTHPSSDDAGDIGKFLAARGIVFERWPLSEEARTLGAKPHLDSAEKQRLLDLFAEELRTKAADIGTEAADVVAIRPDLPGIDGALAKFDKVHYHDDDEIRAIVGGHGVFGFIDDDGRQFLLTVEAGEYISVPAGTWHWFYCGEDRFITALRLFTDTAGWVPHYRSVERGVPA